MYVRQAQGNEKSTGNPTLPAQSHQRAKMRLSACEGLRQLETEELTYCSCVHGFLLFQKCFHFSTI